MKCRSAVLLAASLGLSTSALAQPATTRPAAVTLKVENAPKAISADLFGIFFEDLNYAADGGLYAELVQNRSFDYSPLERPDWTAMTGWQVVTRGGAKGGAIIADADPLNANNTQYLVLNSDVPRPANATPDFGVGVSNDGVEGIPLKAGEAYNFSAFARTRQRERCALQVRLESASGTVLASQDIPALTTDWAKYTAVLTPSVDELNARLVVLNITKSAAYLDMISLMPAKTFKGRANGLRADLAQTVAELQPKFIRFPGGCLVHGDGIRHIYNWKDTIGPVEARKGGSNIWRYHQGVGLGYYEYFQFCEDIGAKPLPVVAAGVSCQNSDRKGGTGQQCIPMADMPAYIQDVLDLVEWANGPAASTWGAKRVAAGHPEPFGLKYLGVGNEDHITPEFEERFKMIYEALKAKHPEMVVIGTAGPSPSGADFDAGWKVAADLKVPIVDEHYYKPPEWFWDNLKRYDTYDRNRPAVYAGEYAAHDRGRQSTLRAALAEAAYLTSLERNGDIVRLSSYAPLLARQGFTQWTPDLIYFDKSSVFPTVSYEVQKLFAQNAGDSVLPIVVQEGRPDAKDANEVTFATSCVRDSRSGDVILKMVSRSDAATPVTIDLSAFKTSTAAVCTTLAGKPDDQNAISARPTVLPMIKPMAITANVSHELPPHSVTIIRLKSPSTR